MFLVNQGANFGWNLESNAPPPVMPMPMPQPGYPPSMPYQNPQYPNYPQNHQTEDDGETVHEEFHSKDAGAMSFAHYIVRWVSSSSLDYRKFLENH